MAALEPLPMSQKKDDLLKHLDMGPDTYTMMANETDRVYKWLMSDKRHLKDNCKRKPPYDWSDFVEKSKDEAMARIARSGDTHTSYYWNLATPNEPNWIARWFLYHKFRYRDGRNRNPVTREDGRHKYSSSSKHPHRHHRHEAAVEESNGYHDEYYNPSARDSENVDHDPQGYGSPATAPASTSNGYGPSGYGTYDAYPAYQYASSAAIYQQDDKQAKGNAYWDPVRDSVQGR